MELHAKLVRAQLNFFKPFVANCSLDVTRKGQDKLGELMTAIHKREVYVREHDFGGFQGAWLTPKDKRRTGVVLYLHGGGYTCGNLEYARALPRRWRMSAACACSAQPTDWRPRTPFPAALDDAVVSYQYLLSKGYGPNQILLCGESAGGGLCYALCLRLKQLKLPLPCGIIAISPWTDLTQSGATFDENRDNDPSLSKELLDFYSACYTQNPKNPLCSPLFGDLKDLPPSLLFAGGDEILLDDAQRLHQKLLDAGCKSKLYIAPERWHAYVLYCLAENMQDDFQSINHFLDKTLSPGQEPSMDEARQRGENLPGGQAAHMDQLLPALGDAHRTHRPSDTARGARRDGAQVPIHCGPSAPGRVLVLFGANSEGTGHSGGEKLPAAACAV